MDPQQHIHAVTRPLGHLGRRDTSVEPRGDAGVPKVVRPLSERRRILLVAEDLSAGLPPGAPVRDRRKVTATHTVEETSASSLADVVPKMSRLYGRTPRANYPVTSRYSAASRLGRRARVVLTISIAHSSREYLACQRPRSLACRAVATTLTQI